MVKIKQKLKIFHYMSPNFVHSYNSSLAKMMATLFLSNKKVGQDFFISLQKS